MEGMNKFQLGLLIVFGLFILFGVAIFAMGGLSGDTPVVAKPTIWGTFDRKLFEKALADSTLAQDKSVKITYVQKNPATFDQEFVEALASDAGPDLIFVTNETVLRNAQRLYPIPYANYSARDFRTNFAEIGEIFFFPQGIIALPVSVDPLVMYWNRDLFTNLALAAPPKLWSEFYDLASQFTKKDSNFNVTQSSAALGEFANISHATNLISLLFMQAGTSITGWSTEGLVESTVVTPPLAAERALAFYTEFSNPLRPHYSWNRSLPPSKNFFLSGNLAMYFGFASESAELRLKNPNLNFDVAAVPQSKDAPRVTTIGTVTGIAIVKNSKDIAGAYRVATLMSGASFGKTFADAASLPPVRRDLLAVKQTQSFLSTFYTTALQAKTWLWPDVQKTPLIFKEMIEGVTGGRSGVSEAVQQVAASLDSQL